LALDKKNQEAKNLDTEKEQVPLIKVPKDIELLPLSKKKAKLSDDEDGEDLAKVASR
jgi:hypothetical protein